MRQNIYMQAGCVATCDGITLKGWAEGDSFSFDDEGAAMIRTKGADGPSANISAAQGGVLSFSLQPTSPVIGKMYELRKAQAKHPRLFTFSYLSGAGEQLNFYSCGFAKLDAVNYGAEKASPVKFNLEYLEFEPDTSATESVDGGFI